MKQILVLNNAKSSNLTVLIHTFIFVDLLFFPRLMFAFGVPISLFIILIDFCFRPLPSKRLLIAIGLLVLMLCSVLYGAATGQNLAPDESLKRAIQLFTILLYSFFRFDTENVRPILVKVLRCFYVWTFGTMLLFYLQPGIYQQVMAMIYPESLDQLENNLDILRFAYFFSDPNSAAYLICFTFVGYLSIERKLNWGIVCSTMAIMCILATQSRGAYVAAAVILLYFSSSLKVPRYKKLLVIISSCLVLWTLVLFYSEEVKQAYSIFDARFDQEEDLGGGRSSKYKYFLENFNFMPIGSGYHLQKEGAEFRPHSDLIRINLSYGFLALPLLLYFVLPRRKSQVLLFLVFIAPFLINTVIDDYRLLGTYLLLFGILGQVDGRSTTNKAKQKPVS
ncbi:O-antigen ligase family protein [Limnobacter sp.]|uniref:O-antigen ligase family protein n=1 Tax=Limnobacter sp. TaxID=2003368 RepID=UPI003748A851